MTETTWLDATAQAELVRRGEVLGPSHGEVLSTRWIE